MHPMRLIVAGAAGRMGRALVRAIHETDGAELSGAFEREGSEALGKDAGELAGVGPLGVKVTDDPLPLVAAAEGALDFTVPAATVALSELVAQARIVQVIGTTGMQEADLKRLDAASRHAVIVRSGNMSLGVNLLAGLARQAARALGPDWDVEIVEMHHRAKVDAPSGTALMLGEAVAEGRKVSLADQAIRARDGHVGPRPEGAIGFATLRGGTVIGDHMVVLAGPGERVELGHRADDRMIFARGAVKAALWGRGRKPGLYGMADVLGLEG